MIQKTEFYEFLLDERENITEEASDGIEISDSISLQDDLGFDSLALLELCLKINQKYGANISDTHTQSIDTVGDLLRIANETMSAE
jgi:phosphopantetheine attachment domain protein